MGVVQFASHDLGNNTPEPSPQDLSNVDLSTIQTLRDAPVNITFRFVPRECISARSSFLVTPRSADGGVVRSGILTCVAALSAVPPEVGPPIFI